MNLCVCGKTTAREGVGWGEGRLWSPGCESRGGWIGRERALGREDSWRKRRRIRDCVVGYAYDGVHVEEDDRRRRRMASVCSWVANAWVRVRVRETAKGAVIGALLMLKWRVRG
jgi:hypothetical protein